jgi:selenocysteine-specific elongation factor
MKDIIVGTAGHIDHGKTSLVKLLTGIDADRLAEEKRRGITIDLGFAHMQLTSDVRLGFVDVPGHERFVRNMLAGAGGIDLVLFVIAADESIKPQTREHFEICRLLGIRGGIVALTKSDLVDADIVELARLEAEEFFAGSFLEGAPIVSVSSTTGAGLDNLREALVTAARRIVVKDASGPARLPIDRAFSMRGFGTVVTGTLISGLVRRDRELVLLPPGRTLRVRGVQTYGRKAEQALAGARTAVNVPDIEAPEIHRGMVLAEPGQFQATRMVDSSVELLKSAKRLKHRSSVHFHSGTAEVQGEVRLFDREFLAPGETAFARFRLSAPLVLAPGDRFILRQFSPLATIGGGCVIDARPPLVRNAARIHARLKILEGTDAAAKAALVLDETPGGMSVDDLAVRLGILPQDALRLARQANAMVVDSRWAAARDWVHHQSRELVRLVEKHHEANPLSPGIQKADLKALIMPGAPASLFDTIVGDAGEIAVEGEWVRRRTHRVALSPEDSAARLRIARILEQAGLAAPSVTDVLALAGVDASRGRAIFKLLLRERALVRINEELALHPSTLLALQDLLRARREKSFTVSDFKSWTGISRKYAVPLLEFCDRQRFTLRNGDFRTVLL